MRKNVAGQIISGHLVNKTDGSDVTTGATSVLVTKDGGAQGAAAGAVTHKGNGEWSYAPTQAETNANHLAFTFVNAAAVSQTLNVYTIGYDPQANLPAQLKAIDNDALTAAALAADAAAEIAAAAATAILATPANKLATDGSGRVTTANPASGGSNTYIIE
jgi:hypothetical protein